MNDQLLIHWKLLCRPAFCRPHNRKLFNFKRIRQCACQLMLVAGFECMVSGDLAPSLGETENKFCLTKFPNDLFKIKKIDLTPESFWWPFLLSPRRHFVDFHCQITAITCDPPLLHFLDQKVLFQNPKFLLRTVFSQFVLCLTSDNSSSQNIGGTDACAVPHLEFCGTFPRKSPALRPCSSA